ncbi:hypothetical protein G7046_g2131 [Stylonectria norvegica]|nr:hypothetical protein G7046_g2131 [Stylonectria norvegica]
MESQQSSSPADGHLSVEDMEDALEFYIDELHVKKMRPAEYILIDADQKRLIATQCVNEVFLRCGVQREEFKDCWRACVDQLGTSNAMLCDANEPWCWPAATLSDSRRFVLNTNGSSTWMLDAPTAVISSIVCYIRGALTPISPAQFLNVKEEDLWAWIGLSIRCYKWTLGSSFEVNIDENAAKDVVRIQLAKPNESRYPTVFCRAPTTEPKVLNIIASKGSGSEDLEDAEVPNQNQRSTVAAETWC